MGAAGQAFAFFEVAVNKLEAGYLQIFTCVQQAGCARAVLLTAAGTGRRIVERVQTLETDLSTTEGHLETLGARRVVPAPARARIDCSPAEAPVSCGAPCPPVITRGSSPGAVHAPWSVNGCQQWAASAESQRRVSSVIALPGHLLEALVDLLHQLPRAAFPLVRAVQQDCRDRRWIFYTL